MKTGGDAGRSEDRVAIPYIAEFRPLDAGACRAALKTAAFVVEHGLASFGRDPGLGHVTASGFILSPDRSRTLLMHHRKLGRWLQPGGHCDGSSDVRAVALRELSEETGLRSLRALGPGLFDVDVHAIPARGSEPAHLHHDVRFLFEADPDEPIPGNAESFELAWIELEDLERFTQVSSVLVVGECGVCPQ